MLTPAIRAMVVLVFRQRERALALPLLVPRVLADHPHDAVAPDDLAVAAHLLHRCDYFHRATPCPIARGKRSAPVKDRTASAPPSPCLPAGCGWRASAFRRLRVLSPRVRPRASPCRWRSACCRPPPPAS